MMDGLLVRTLLAEDVYSIREMNISNIDLEDLRKALKDTNESISYNDSALPVLMACGESYQEIQYKQKALRAVAKVMIAFINLKIAIDENTEKESNL